MIDFDRQRTLPAAEVAALLPDLFTHATEAEDGHCCVGGGEEPWLAFFTGLGGWYRSLRSPGVLLSFALLGAGCARWLEHLFKQ